MDGSMAGLALLAGALIGLTLALVGGGGSILAVPLLVHLVGASSAHAAIGTGAVAVALNALVGLAGHARAGTVKWPCALSFGVAGIAGAALGAELGKATDGGRLLALFGLLMIAVGASMLRRPRGEPDPGVRLSRESARHLLPRLLPAGLAVGLLSGFFGIGGGFLIVPALLWATAMPMANAVGTSLVAVSAFGLTTSASYALSGLVDWWLVAPMLAGGVAGAWLGQRMGAQLAARQELMRRGFGLLVMMMGALVALRAR
jgi:uncharacterized membrane protein YfcA